MHEVGGDLTAIELKAIRTAIQSGVRDENRLTDLVFNTRHPERSGKRLQPKEELLAREWLDIRDRLVRPALQSPSGAGTPVTPAPPTVAQPASTTSGVEAADNTTPIIQCILKLQDQGRSISFVQRYLRDLTHAEVTALKNAGLRIVSCYEEGNATDMAYFTRTQGQHDGKRGFTQAQAAGQAADTPVYFAVDTDPETSQRQAILDYFQGIGEGYEQYLADMQAKKKPVVTYAVGVYGSSCVLGWCQSAGFATWFWQAHAPAWCNNRNRTIWPGVNIHTSGGDTPKRCGWRLGHLEGWGNEGGW